MSNSKKIKLFTVSLVLIIIGGYSIFQAKNIIAGPTLKIDSPANGATLTQNIVYVKGTTKNISRITLNDSPIFVDEDGLFGEKIIVSSGYSVIKLSVTDRFGRNKTKYIEVVATQEPILAHTESEVSTGQKEDDLEAIKSTQ